MSYDIENQKVDVMWSEDESSFKINCNNAMNLLCVSS